MKLLCVLQRLQTETVNDETKTFFLKCFFCFIETNSKLLFDKGLLRIIIGTIKESTENEGFYENFAVIMKSIATSLRIVDQLKHLFTEAKWFSFVLPLLCKFYQNRIICECLTKVSCVTAELISNHVMIEKFEVFKKSDVDFELAGELKKELDAFFELNGMETVSKVLKEHLQERNIVINCIQIFDTLSWKEGKQYVIAPLSF